MAKLIYEIPADKAKEGAAAIKKALMDMGVQAEVVDKAFSKQEKQLARQGQAYDRLARDLDPVIKKTQDYERAQRTINRALEIGKINQAEHARMLDLARQRYAAAENSTKGWIGQLSAARAAIAGLGLGVAISQLTRFAEAGLEAREAVFRLNFAIAQRPDAGFDVNRLSQVAEGMKGASPFDDEPIKEAMAALARFESVGGANIERLTQLSLDFAVAMRTDVVTAATMLGKALDSPGQGLKALTDAVGYLDPQMKKLIADLVESGREAEASSILFGLLESRVGGMAEKFSKEAPGAWQMLKVQIGDLNEWVGEAIIKWVEFHNSVRDFFQSLHGIDFSGKGAGVVGESASVKAARQASLLDLGKQLAAEQQLRDLKVWMAKKEVEAGDAAAAAHKKAGEAAARHAAKLADLKLKIDGIMAAAEKSREWGMDFGAAGVDALSQRLARAAAITKEMATDEERRNDAIVEANALYAEGLITAETHQRVLEANVHVFAVEMPAALQQISDEMEQVGQDWEEFSAEAARAFEDHIKGALLEVAMEMAHTGDPFLDGMIEIFARLVIEWAITQAKMLALTAKRIAAEKAMQAGANAMGGGGGGGGGWMSYLGQAASTYFGGAGAGGSAMGLGGAGGGFGGMASGFYGASSGSGGAGAGLWSQAGGWGGAAGMAVWVAAIAVILNQAKTSGRAEAYAEITGTLQQLDANDVMTNRQGRSKGGQVASVANVVIGMLRDFYSQVTSNVERDLPSSITIGREGQGKKTDWIVKYANGVIRSFGGDMQAAMEFAAIQAAKESELAGLDPNVAAAIQNSVAESWGAFQDDVAFAMEYTSLGLDAVAQQFRSTVDQYREMIDRAVELGMDASIGFAALGADLAAQRNAILGIEESPEQRIRRQAAAFEAERVLTMAKLQLEDAELAIKQQELEADVAILREEAELTKARLNLRGEALEIESGYLGAEAQMLGASLETLKSILAARELIAGTLAELGNLGIGEIDIQGAIGRAGGGRGAPSLPEVTRNFGRHVDRFGGHVNQLRDTWKDNMERFKETLLEARQDENISPLTERERLLESFGSFQALLDAASGGNVTAQGELPEAYRSLLALAKEFSGGGGGLGFLGLGAGYEEFFSRLEAMSLAFIESPRPKRLFEGSIVFDERFHRTAQDHLANDRQARVETDRNLKALRITETETKTELVREIRTLGSSLAKAITATPRWAA